MRVLNARILGASRYEALTDEPPTDDLLSELQSRLDHSVHRKVVRDQHTETIRPMDKTGTVYITSWRAA